MFTSFKTSLYILLWSISLLPFTGYGQTQLGYKWAKGISGELNVEGSSVITDRDNFVYVTGNFNGSATFKTDQGEIVLKSLGSADIFIAKLDSLGNCLWAVRAGEEGDDRSSSIGLGQEGEVYITGSIKNQLFLASINNTGTSGTFKKMEGDAGSHGNDLVLGSDGNVYIIGSFEGTLDFNPDLEENIYTSRGSSDVFVAAYDQTGNYLWARTMGGPGPDAGNSLDIDAEENIYLTGNYTEEITFSTDLIIPGFGGADIFLAKLAKDQTLSYARGIGGKGNDSGQALEVSEKGATYLTGFFEGDVNFGSEKGEFLLTSQRGSDAFIGVFDNLGITQAVKREGGKLGEKSLALALSDNYVYTGGIFYNSEEDAANANTDIILTKYAYDLSSVSSLKIGGSSADIINSITVNVLGSLYTTGSFEGTATFDAGYQKKLTSTSQKDGFIAKYGDCTPPEFKSSLVGDTLCEGEGHVFSIEGSEDMVYKWYKDDKLLDHNSLPLSFQAVTAQDAGSYLVVGTNSCQSVTSNYAELVVNTKPVISSQPEDTAACEFSNASFKVETSTTDVNFQWWYNNETVSNGTTGTLIVEGSFQSSISDKIGIYSATLTNECGTTYSDSATLSVAKAPVIVTSPTSKTVCYGEEATFTVEASGENLTYNWYDYNTETAVGTGKDLTVKGDSLTNGKRYSVLVNSSCNGISTDPVNLTVDPKTEILDHPDSVNICPNGSDFLVVKANGKAPLSYTWRKDNTVLDINSDTLFLTNISTENSGKYTVDVNGGCGTIISDTALVTVITSPVITEQPTAQITCPGESASFTAEASGGDLTYQWHSMNTAIQADGKTLTIPGVSAANEGEYFVSIANNCEVVNSDTVPLRIKALPQIVSSPQSKDVCPGDDVTFEVEASGSDLNYQWFNSTNTQIGANSSLLTVSDVNADNEGAYYVTVSNNCDTVKSQNFNLRVYDGVQITTQPTGVSVCEGESPTLSVEATGSGNLLYEWKRNSVSVNLNSFLLNLDPVSLIDVGKYTVTVSGTCGSVTSDTAIVNVKTGPTINTQPTSKSYCLGSPATFSVDATGLGTVSYQWILNDTQIVGTDNDSLIISEVNNTTTGNYNVKISDRCGSTTSESATLTIDNSLTITGQPEDLEVCPGEDVELQVSTSTYGTSYQWFKNYEELITIDNDVLNITDVSVEDTGKYSVIVTNDCGVAHSNTFNLRLKKAPTIASKPLNTSVCEGESALFGVKAEGEGNLSYTWVHIGDNNISLTGDDTLIFNNVLPEDTGKYVVQVTSECGLVSSDTVSINLKKATKISNSPEDITVCAGNSVSFEVEAEGSGDLNYDWIFNDIGYDLNSSVLNLPRVTNEDDGTYYVNVTGECGSKGAFVNLEVLSKSDPVCFNAKNEFYVTDIDGHNLTTQTAGEAFSVKISAYKNGDLDTDFNKTVDSVFCNLSNNIPGLVTFVRGEAVLNNVVITQSDSAEIYLNYSGDRYSSNRFYVSPGSFTTFKISKKDGSELEEAYYEDLKFPVVISAIDNWGNTIDSINEQFTIESSALLPENLKVNFRKGSTPPFMVSFDTPGSFPLKLKDEAGEVQETSPSLKIKALNLILTGSEDVIPGKPYTYQIYPPIDTSIYPGVSFRFPGSSSGNVLLDSQEGQNFNLAFLPRDNSSEVELATVEIQAVQDTSVNSLNMLTNINKDTPFLSNPECVSSDTCSGSYVSLFRLGGMEKRRDSCSIINYSDYTAKKLSNSDFVLGSKYQLTIEYNGADSAQKAYMVWIDLNNNSKFYESPSESEELVRFAAFSGTSTSTSVTIPASLKYEGAKRLRVAIVEGSEPIANSCELAKVSEMQDYLVVLERPSTLEAADIITPNGDGYNDYFTIEGINPDADNNLVVFDRWGNVLYSKDNYQNDWNGNLEGKNLLEGTYYYVFKHGDETIKGFFEVKY